MKTRFKCNKSRLIRLLPAALMLTVLLAAGCGSQNQFVLLPDPDGHVGKLSVSNESGELILDKAGESTTAAAEKLRLIRQYLTRRVSRRLMARRWPRRLKGL